MTDASVTRPSADASRSSDLVVATLDEIGELVRTAIAASMDDVPEPMRNLMLDYPLRPAKAIRPAILLESARAWGGRLETGLASAIAIEIFHNAFLIHDDLEDDSLTRRGAPTLHRLAGRARAINVGDALLDQGHRALSQNRQLLGDGLAADIAREFALMTTWTVEGQQTELDWRDGGWVDLEPRHYLDLVMRKTCWYTTVLPARVGALLGARPPGALHPIVRFGFLLGVAFQIRDDVLNIVGDPERYGKELLGDIVEGKRTLMLIHLLAAAEPGHRAMLESLFQQGHQRDREQAEWIAALMSHYRSVEFANEFAHDMARAAETAFGRAFAGCPDSRHRRFLHQLIPFMLDRDR